MRIVIQRVSHASVTIEGHCKSSIGKGMLILVGIEESDGQEDIDWLCKKIVNLRIFDDENGLLPFPEIAGTFVCRQKQLCLFLLSDDLWLPGHVVRRNLVRSRKYLLE